MSLSMAADPGDPLPPLLLPLVGALVGLVPIKDDLHIQKLIQQTFSVVKVKEI